MKNTAFAAIAALLLSVAASAQVARVTGPWDKLEGQHSRIAERRTVAVTDSMAWEKVWKEHDANSPVPAVNFNEESVVAVFLGETKTGVKIEIVVQKDMIDADRLNVFYKEIVSNKGFAAQVVCQPFAMVKVPKTKVVSFEVNGRMSIPETAKPPKNPRDDSKVRALLETLPSFDGR
jgi:hypothetical protein